jgi:hypothetical protein
MQEKRCPELVEGKKPKAADSASGIDEPDTPYRKKRRMTPVVSLSNHGLRLSRQSMRWTR